MLHYLFIKKLFFDVNQDYRKTYEESDETKHKLKKLSLFIKCL